MQSVLTLTREHRLLAFQVTKGVTSVISVLAGPVEVTPLQRRMIAILTDAAKKALSEDQDRYTVRRDGHQSEAPLSLKLAKTLRKANVFAECADFGDGIDLLQAYLYVARGARLDTLECILACVLVAVNAKASEEYTLKALQTSLGAHIDNMHLFRDPFYGDDLSTPLVCAAFVTHSKECTPDSEEVKNVWKAITTHRGGSLSRFTKRTSATRCLMNCCVGIQHARLVAGLQLASPVVRIDYAAAKKFLYANDGKEFTPHTHFFDYTNQNECFLAILTMFRHVCKMQDLFYTPNKSTNPNWVVAQAIIPFVVRLNLLSVVYWEGAGDGPPSRWSISELDKMWLHAVLATSNGGGSIHLSRDALPKHELFEGLGINTILEFMIVAIKRTRNWCLEEDVNCASCTEWFPMYATRLVCMLLNAGEEKDNPKLIELEALIKDAGFTFGVGEPPVFEQAVTDDEALERKKAKKDRRKAKKKLQKQAEKAVAVESDADSVDWAEEPPPLVCAPCAEEGKAAESLLEATAGMALAPPEPAAPTPSPSAGSLLTWLTEDVSLEPPAPAPAPSPVEHSGLECSLCFEPITGRLALTTCCNVARACTDCADALKEKEARCPYCSTEGVAFLAIVV